MLRNTLLKVLAPAALAIGGVPAIASAHSHAFIRFGFGCGPYYQSAYCAPAYVAPAPAVVYAAPAPVVVAPPVVYSAPAVVVAPTPAPAPAIVVAPVPAPVVVYSNSWCYPHYGYYDHVRWYRR